MSSPFHDVIIDATLGAVFVGFAVSCVIYGILLSQIASYFKNYPGDRPIYKYLVILVLLLETADQSFIGHLLYYYSISNYAKPLALVKGDMTWSFILQQLCGSVVGAIVKIVFGLRVWRFSEQNFWITGVVLILTLGQLCLTIAFTVMAFQLRSVFEVHQLQKVGTISLGVGVLTDVVTAAALSFYLSRLRTGLKTSDSLVRSLVRYAISTGALTSAVSITVVILYNMESTINLYFIAVYFTLSKLYAISFMTTLNTRRIVRGRGTDHQDHTTNNTNMFRLGTRMPSMGSELERWDKVDPPVVPRERLWVQGHNTNPPALAY